MINTEYHSKTWLSPAVAVFYDLSQHPDRLRTLWWPHEQAALPFRRADATAVGSQLESKKVLVFFHWISSYLLSTYCMLILTEHLLYAGPQSMHLACINSFIPGGKVKWRCLLHLIEKRAWSNSNSQEGFLSKARVSFAGSWTQLSQFTEGLDHTDPNKWRIFGPHHLLCRFPLINVWFLYYRKIYVSVLLFSFLKKEDFFYCDKNTK